MITESDNTAWVMLNRYLGRYNIEAELYSIGARSTAYLVPNTTTASDVLVMLEKVADPSYTSLELSAEMLDIMTNTSFEDRLPQPLPEGARVAHKIGSYGDTFSDAGLVFTEGSQDAHLYSRDRWRQLPRGPRAPPSRACPSLPTNPWRASLRSPADIEGAREPPQVGIRSTR
jgi:hypothetical protein